MCHLIFLTRLREHRKRKENYVKDLEQDIARLRECISSAEKETAAFEKENSAMKSTLSTYNILSSDASYESPTNILELSPLSDFDLSAQLPPNLLVQHQGISSLPSDSPGSVASVHFDTDINYTCLHLTPNGYDSTYDFNFDLANFQDAPITSSEGTTAVGQSAPPAPLTAQDVHSLPGMPPQPDTSDIAVNFILALEHPCREHIHNNNPGGHELMVSTLLYSHAPDAPNIDSCSWSVPSTDLCELWRMSQCLPREDWEITPVQAWFLLTERYDVKTLLGKGGRRLCEIKKGLAELVGCFYFGAVMEREKFWDVVNRVMSENPT